MWSSNYCCSGRSLLPHLSPDIIDGDIENVAFRYIVASGRKRNNTRKHLSEMRNSSGAIATRTSKSYANMNAHITDERLQ